MEVIRQAAELNTGGRKVCLAIGMFDGVHLGHQQVLRQTIHDARQHGGLSVAITFDRHPGSVVAPDRTPPLIYSLPQKLRAIESLGLDATLLLEFTSEFSRISGETFVRSLARDFKSVYSICVGSAFTFGHQRTGNVSLLQTLGKELGFSVHGLAAVSLDDQVVSSTRIRDALKAGDLDAAGQMLGRAYSLAGQVIRGDQLGQKIGFPTANLDIAGLLTPPNGVYAVHAKLDERTYQAVVNIGLRPTVQNAVPEKRVEVHLLDFSGDIYEKELEVTFLSCLRPERRFPSLEHLKQQIARDIHAARSEF